MCKGPFICTPDGGVTPEIEQFGKCLYATDCLMGSCLCGNLSIASMAWGAQI